MANQYATLNDLHLSGKNVAKHQIDDWVKDEKVRIVLFRGDTLYSLNDVNSMIELLPRKTVFYTKGGISEAMVKKYDIVYGDDGVLPDLFNEVFALVRDYTVDTLVVPGLKVLPGGSNFIVFIDLMKKTRTKLLVLNEEW